MNNATKHREYTKVYFPLLADCFNDVSQKLLDLTTRMQSSLSDKKLALATLQQAIISQKKQDDNCELLFAQTVEIVKSQCKILDNLFIQDNRCVIFGPVAEEIIRDKMKTLAKLSNSNS